ncbi:hypothetical protein [Nitrospira sp. M1]
MTQGFSHTNRSEYVFTSFLIACPIMASQVTVDRYPDETEQFPDVVTTLNGCEVWWELGEWLNPKQMQAAMKLKDLRSKLRATFDGLDNLTRHVMRCTLQLRRTMEDLSDNLAPKCCKELSDLLLDADALLQTQGQLSEPILYPKVKEYQVLAKFIDRIWIWKKSEQQDRFSSVPWIMFQDPGGSYDPEEANSALKKVVTKKVSRYALTFDRDVRLIIHYGQAYAYNTPFESPTHLTFKELAQKCADWLSYLPPSAFRKVYLLDECKREAYELAPLFCSCE